MIDLFLTFLKINFLTPSGPASVGLTKQLVVPSLISTDKFNQILAISSGIPGSDAIQLAWQIGYAHKGIPGAFISILGALLPCILLASLVMVGLNFIDPKILGRFINGVKPALIVLLAVTAIGMLPAKSLDLKFLIALLVVIPLFYLKVPVLAIIIISGIIGLI